MWRKLQHLSWHWWGRIVLFIMLLDQWHIPLDFLAVQTDTTITLTLIGLLFAPLPTEKKS